jgi:hypothetical protein
MNRLEIALKTLINNKSNNTRQKAKIHPNATKCQLTQNP